MGTYQQRATRRKERMYAKGEGGGSDGMSSIVDRCGGMWYFVLREDMCGPCVVWFVYVVAVRSIEVLTIH